MAACHALARGWLENTRRPLFPTVGFIATISSNSAWLVYVALPNNLEP